MFLFDVQQRSPWNSDAAIEQAYFQNGMSHSVFAGGMMMEFSNRLYFPGSLESLSVVNDEKQMSIFLGEQSSQHIQCNLLADCGFIPVASPEEFAVIGPVRSVSQRLNEPFDGAAVADADR
jgi:hypothetical protein